MSSKNPAPTSATPRELASPGLLVLSLSALGVVFGDIGTSPLYALRGCFEGPEGVGISHENILGVLSLVSWSLIIVISLKYLLYVLRADNKGEGGILALWALTTGKPREPETSPGSPSKKYRFLAWIGIIGVALLLGDATITPAISVLSAIEGLNEATSVFKDFIVELCLGVLLFLFLLQRRGTEFVGKIFGPVMIVWFFVIGLLGVLSILKSPAVLWALNPVHAVSFFAQNGFTGFWVLGAVFLVVTGGEALYADLGHFGRSPIHRAWFFLVMPALLANYFGQGALLLAEEKPSLENLFFQLVPNWAVIPMVILATAATVIASQAVITGAFSLAKQAVQFGFWPRLQILFPSNNIGQVYVPLVNWALLVATFVLVLGFRESKNLAAAYGIAVSGTMFLTALLALFALDKIGGKRLKPFLFVAGILFLTVDAAFLVSNLPKIFSGGWVVLAFGAALFILMQTWIKGRSVLRARQPAERMPLSAFLLDAENHPPVRVKGTAFFLSGTRDVVPRALLHNFKHNGILHERIFILGVLTEERPYVPEEERLEVSTLGQGFYSVWTRYGFCETPDIPVALKNLEVPGFRFEASECSFFLGKDSLVSGVGREMSFWRKMLFAFLARNAQEPGRFFRLPANRVVELGAQTEL